MSAHFTIDVEPDRDLVRIVMAGFFTPEDIGRFVVARGDAHRLLRCAPNVHLTINDLRRIKIQPQDTVAGFQRVLADPRYRSKRLGFIVSASLARMQLMRALGSRDARFFTDADEAEAWVLTGEEPRDRAIRPVLRSA